MSGTTIIAIAVMVLVLIGMLVIKKTMAASPMLQPILFLCVALELGLVVFVFYKQLNPSPSSTRLEKQKRIYYTKGFIAGKAIKDDASGKLVLVLSSGSQEDMSVKELIKGLQKSFGGITVAEVANGNSEEIQEITAAMVNAALKEHADADIIAFMGTLPANYSSLSTGKAKLFLFDTGSAELKRLKRDVESGKIIGIMWPKSNQPKPGDDLEKTEQQIFDRRYIIITKGNIGANAEIFK